jgi:hypothetical protein
MTEYITPTTDEFSNAEQVVTDVMATASPQAMTKAGSAIRELVIRPISYLLAWISGNIDHQFGQTSVSTLRNSQETENPLADAVASNYFVTRRAATRSTGVVTLTLNTSSLSLPQGTLFTAEGATLRTSRQVVVTPAAVAEKFDTILYVIAIAAGDEYLAAIPVEAVETGALEIPAGADITLQRQVGAVTGVELTSPVTGGLDIETDAQMMERAEYNTAGAGIGSYNGLRKRLEGSPVTVLGMCVVAGEDAPLFRARYNTLGINPGGRVDMYVKTQLQSSTATLDVNLADAAEGEDVTIELPADKYQGLYRVINVLVKGEYLADYSVSFGSSSPLNPSRGARLSEQQTCTVTFQAPADLDSEDVASITVEYMPGIKDLQDYVNSPENAFLGQDVLVKSAVPVTLGLDCALVCPRQLDDADIADVKRIIAATVNGLRVGNGYLNFSDVQKAVQIVYPDIQLRLPCTIRARMVLRDGSVDTFYSDTGVLDLTTPVNSEYWEYQMCFFSLIESHIRITQIA